MSTPGPKEQSALENYYGKNLREAFAAVKGVLGSIEARKKGEHISGARDLGQLKIGLAVLKEIFEFVEMYALTLLIFLSEQATEGKNEIWGEELSMARQQLKRVLCMPKPGEKPKEDEEGGIAQNPLLKFLGYVTSGLRYTISAEELDAETGEDIFDRLQASFREFIEWISKGAIVAFKDFDRPMKRSDQWSSRPLPEVALALNREVILLRAWEGVMDLIQKIEDMLEGHFGNLPRNFPLLQVLDRIVKGEIPLAQKQKLGGDLNVLFAQDTIGDFNNTLSAGDVMVLNVLFEQLLTSRWLISTVERD